MRFERNAFFSFFLFCNDIYPEVVEYGVCEFSILRVASLLQTRGEGLRVVNGAPVRSRWLRSS